MSEEKSVKALKKKSMSSFYIIEGEKIKHINPTCDRCGSGYFMADHGNRYSCGHCGFTKYRLNKPLEK